MAASLTKSVIGSRSVIARYTGYYFGSCSIHANNNRLLSSETSEDVVLHDPRTLQTDNLDDELMSLRDVSRMPTQYRDRMRHVMKAPEQPDYITDMHRSLELKRRLYAKYGRGSGLEPGMLWPSEADLAEQIEFEKEWEPPLDRMIALAKEQRMAEAKGKREKRLFVEKQMTKMPQFIDEYRKKLSKADEQEQQREAKRQALLEEARDYFGFDIDTRDPRFERMQEMKEEQEKKMKKLKKKEAKTTRWLDVMKKENPQQSA